MECALVETIGEPSFVMNIIMVLSFLCHAESRQHSFHMMPCMDFHGMVFDKNETMVGIL